MNWLKMGLFQKLAGSFSIKWEFGKMGISEVSTARIAKNGIPLYRETPVVSKGTKNHMFLVDLINKSITGKDVEETLGRANITLNKNAVPNDPQSRFVTSGLRIGTPAVTTRGFKEDEGS